ncbi:hypothetical protein [Yeosuana marina]|uniref:hypothetical protein n=1 Tax=Yeosuana marina TaxID=1565536 RepID=UPI001421C88C|nr:hypothetical protein [Yeosuana marina]
MKQLFFKIAIYAFLILLVLEGIIRIFHLTKDYPARYVDRLGVEKWVPDQEGYSVTGIRRQNFSKYNINDFGYNSYREFKPTNDKFEIALVGDSFVEGFHQHYYNSTGKKIENLLHGIEVYEFGYAGYDFADELHLIHKYQATFDLIDHVFIGLKFENDLHRGEYNIVPDRIKLESPMYRSLRKIKLLVYLQNIGAFSAARELTRTLLSFGQDNPDAAIIETESKESKKQRYLSYISNFESLVNTYGYNKKRYTLLINKTHTPMVFLTYLDLHGFTYLDFSESFQKSVRPTTLIYDMHWNDHGRDIIAQLISQYLQSEFNDNLLK